MIKIKKYSVYPLLFVCLTAYYANAQETNAPDNTRVKKQVTETEKPKQTPEEFKTDLQRKIRAIEKEIYELRDEADKNQRSQSMEYKRLYDNLLLNKDRLKGDIKSFKEATAESTEKYKNEINQAYKNLKLEVKRLREEVHSRGETILKDSEK